MADKNPELYVVVCQDFHSAWGIFPSLGQAVKYALYRTNRSKSGCVYLPMPLSIEGDVEIRQFDAEEKPVRGYL